ncbi:MAG: hypothetical protein WD716_13105 [Fimbriimonadaceae bacterium]
MKAGKVIALGVALTAVGGLVAVGCFVRSLDGIFENEVTDQMARWPDFYREEMEPVIKLPPEAKPQSATMTSGFGVGINDVTFTLPATKPPKEWLVQIANDAGVIQYRISDNLYDAGSLSEKSPKKMDHFEISYDPATKLYRAWWGFS